ncbi:MAG TPA: VOC family protein [Kofleriaceae bacterium]|nr:VOC family protein [Kofleriaceae bacterium]
MNNVPAAGEVVLDHVGLFVPDMARAADAFARLGFRLTPFSPQRHRLAPGQPLVPAGTANRLAMLAEGYIEILTPVADTPVARQLHAAIGRYAGLHLIAFGDDAAAAHARLSDEDFAPQPVIHLERTVETATGEDTARFSVVRVPTGTMAEGRVQYCQHHTPELVWQERWLEQPNRARALAGLVLCVADPAEAAARHGRFVGRQPRRANGSFLLELERGVLVFTDPEGLARLLPGAQVPELPFMAALALTTDEFAATRALLARNSVATIEVGAGAIAAPLPGGLAGSVCFVASGTAAPWGEGPLSRRARS